MDVRKLRVSCDSESSLFEWLLIEDYHARRWDLLCNGAYAGTLLWSPQQLRWEPRIDEPGCQPSDTMLKLFHILIRESSPVPRVMDCPDEPG